MNERSNDVTMAEFIVIALLVMAGASLLFWGADSFTEAWERCKHTRCGDNASPTLVRAMFGYQCVCGAPE